eukprot:GILI01002218.1.p1 GENE.GILI01002218.1~~GILI01002218.1.p1  ORF type:complete len:112 (+),score=17.65 GILI01002218.1:69-404(+)
MFRTISRCSGSQSRTIVFVVPMSAFNTTKSSSANRFEVPSPMLLHHLRRGGACTSAASAGPDDSSQISQQQLHSSPTRPFGIEQVAGRSQSDLAATYGSAASVMGQFKGMA